MKFEHHMVLRFLVLLPILFSCQTLPFRERKLVWKQHPGIEGIKNTTHSQCGVVGDTMYIYSGFKEGSENALNDALISYDLKSEKWKINSTRNGPKPSSLSTIEVFGRNILVYGGEVSGQQFSNDAFIFDTKSEVWLKLSHTEKFGSRSMASAASTTRFIALFGGKSNAKNRQWARFDTKRLQFEVFNNDQMTATVGQVALDIGNDRVFVWGGFSGTQKQSTGFILDLGSNQIFPLKVPTILSARANSRAVHHGNRVYIWGGSTHDRNANSGATYNIESSEWMVLPAIPDSRYNDLRSAEIIKLREEGFLLVGGRFGKDEFNQDLWFFDFVENAWKKLIPEGRLPGRIAHCVQISGSGKPLVYGGLGYREGSKELVHFDGIWSLDSIE